MNPPFSKSYKPRATSHESWLNEKLKNIPSALAEKLQSPDRIIAEILAFTKIGHSVENIAVHIVDQDLIKCEESDNALKQCLQQ